MPSVLKKRRPLKPTALLRSGTGASVTQAFATWQGITAVMTPIIGQKGMAALFRRSLQLALVDHPLLATADRELSDLEDFQTLQAHLATQTEPASRAACQALLHHFQAQLERLIGASLTQQLLGTLLENPSCGPAPEEVSP